MKLLAVTNKKEDERVQKKTPKICSDHNSLLDLEDKEAKMLDWLEMCG